MFPKSPSTLVIASQNPGKIKELKKLLSPLGVTLKTTLELDLPDVEEDQDTFSGNAEKKAREVMEATKLPALADDSGLCVDYLNGGPGVYTARYGTYERLLKEMQGVPTEQRAAHFVCVLALAIPGEKTALFEGRVDGSITKEPQGEGGFGYDPVFQPEGYDITFAQMSSEQKHALSHRGEALAKFAGYLSERL